jgi:hypothetical protein
VRRVDVLMGGFATDADYQSDLEAFIAEMRQLGWNEGRNLRIDVRWNDGDDGLTRSYAAQLIPLMPDVILAHSPLNLTVIQQATRTVPVVFLRVRSGGARLRCKHATPDASSSRGSGARWLGRWRRGCSKMGGYGGSVSLPPKLRPRRSLLSFSRAQTQPKLA